MKRFALLSAMTLASIGATHVVAQDYEADWSGHQNVVINTTGTGAGIFKNVTGFPLLVRLDDTSAAVFTAAQADGADIRFTKADNTTLLPHHIETWDNTAQSAAIWVLVDTVYGNRNNQAIRMHWGNASATDESDAAAVFDSSAGFRAVWHMDGTGDVKDVTYNDITAVANGSPGTTDGVIGEARSFDGSSSYFDVPGSATGLHFPAFGNFSISAWVKPAAVTGDAAIVSKGDYAYALKNFRETAYEFFDFQDSWVAARSLTAPEADTWVHLFAVNSELGPRFYLNGVLEDANPYMEGTGGRNDGLNVNIGREPEGTGGRRYFNGVIDEVRVHDTVRTVEWARLEYQTQRQGQTAVSLSDTLPTLDTTSAPGVPTAVTATEGAFAGMVSLSWTAPTSTGGAAITGYKAVAVNDSSKTCASTGATTCTIVGLTPDSSYTFVVQAQNAVGTGEFSEPSNSLKIPVSLQGSLVIRLTGNRNPFVFRLPAGLENADNLSLSIIDTYGRTVWNHTVNPARDNVSRISWNGKTSTGAQAAAGVYVVRVRYTERGKTVHQNLKGVTLAPR